MEAGSLIFEIVGNSTISAAKSPRDSASDTRQRLVFILLAIRSIASISERNIPLSLSLNGLVPAPDIEEGSPGYPFVDTLLKNSLTSPLIPLGEINSLC